MKRINFAHYLDVKKVLVDMTNFAKSFSIYEVIY